MQWLFDLDGTLHQDQYGVAKKISESMTGYIEDYFSYSRLQADALRRRYINRYGATLAGLIAEVPSFPVQDFLYFTHPLETLLPLVVAEYDLPQSLKALPGNKYILSNAPTRYVEAVLDCLNVRSFFKALGCCDSFSYLHFKPQVSAYTLFLQAQRLNAPACILVDDRLANLVSARKLNMKTVWLRPAIEEEKGVNFLYIDSIHQLAALYNEPLF